MGKRELFVLLGGMDPDVGSSCFCRALPDVFLYFLVLSYFSLIPLSWEWSGRESLGGSWMASVSPGLFLFRTSDHHDSKTNENTKASPLS